MTLNFGGQFYVSRYEVNAMIWPAGNTTNIVYLGSASDNSDLVVCVVVMVVVVVVAVVVVVVMGVGVNVVWVCGVWCVVVVICS